jgi:hypothetical protein
VTAVLLLKGDKSQSKGKQHKKPAEAAVNLKIGGDMFLRNIGLSPNYTAVQPFIVSAARASNPMQ